jgi:hypothetical protein
MMSLFLLLRSGSFDPLLLAQSGAAKTAVGWVIVLLCIVLALLVVARPSGRRMPEGDKKRR